jgi:dipeptidyl aminopeptidase/acylaminoacyl peptidase
MRQLPRTLRLIAIILFGVPVLSVLADDSLHTVTVDDHFTLAYVTSVVISPSGETVAYVESRWNENSKERKSDIWRVAADGMAEPERLTFEPGAYGSLTWSPDGKFLYFTCGRHRPGNSGPPYDGTNQLWRMPAAGGEIVPITQVGGGIDGFVLAHDGRSIVYQTTSRKYDDDWAKLRSEFSDIDYGEPKSVTSKLTRLDLATWRQEPVFEFEGYVDVFAIAPQGDRIALVTAKNNRVVTVEGHTNLTILDIPTGKHYNLPDEVWRKQAPSPYGRLYSPHWSADGQALVFAITFDAYPSELITATWSGDAAPKIARLPRPGRVSLGGGVDDPPQVAWIGKSRDLCFLGDDAARVRVYKIRDATGKPQHAGTLTPDDVVVDTFSIDDAGQRIATVTSGPGYMPDVFAFENEKQTQLTDINPHTKKWKLPKISAIGWEGAAGAKVEGVLELPPDRKPDERVPVIIKIHGGPTAASPLRMQYDAMGSVLYPSQGIAVLAPNYRGSTGYGDEFMTQLIGHGNEIDVDDILRGVEYLISEGIADPKRIGVAGWSNGGYLTNCVCTKSKRFAAASSGAGIMDMVQEWGTNDEPAYTLVFAQGAPWQKPDVFRRFSPIYAFDKVTTPMIFHVGAEDPRCPPGNCKMAYRALKETLGREAQLLVYPNMGHGLGSYQARKTKLAWDLAWFKHYLSGEPIPKK